MNHKRRHHRKLSTQHKVSIELPFLVLSLIDWISAFSCILEAVYEGIPDPKMETNMSQTGDEMTKTGSPFELLNLMLNIMLNVLHWTEMIMLHSGNHRQVAYGFGACSSFFLVECPSICHGTSSAYPPASYSSTHTYISSFSPHLPSSSAATACSQNLGR